MVLFHLPRTGRSALVSIVLAASWRGERATSMMVLQPSTLTRHSASPSSSHTKTSTIVSSAEMKGGGNSSAASRRRGGSAGREALPKADDEDDRAIQNDDTSLVSKTSIHHSARLAMLCVHNAYRMGARTQLSLCPPGKCRRSIQAALRQRTAAQQQQWHNMTPSNKQRGRAISSSADASQNLELFVGPERLEEYEVLEEDYLIHTNTLEVDSDEEASSGDDDDLLDINALFSEEPVNLDDENMLSSVEPLYTPVNTEGGGGNQKLPFNWKKLRYFDVISAEEVTMARNYLKAELRRSKQRAARALCRSSIKEASLLATLDAEISLSSIITPFEPPMTPAIAASLLIESLTVNPYESIEGMAACYDGIIAAGVALLDSPDPTQPVQTRASRSEIMAALAPLLITTLQPESGEVIRLLAQLRRMCATQRYRRRFVQRIAPALIRPPGAAMWCLKHQNDMLAILAAAELIFDAAFDVFRKGWYERGRWMLADSQRAETLSAAAMQLRNLSQEPLAADGWNFLNHHSRRNRRLKSGAASAGGDHHLDEPLTEWEVVAVDRQIRRAIASVFSTDWTRAAVHETVPRPSRQRAVSTGGGSAQQPQRRVESSSPRTPRSPRSSKAPASPLSESSLLSVSGEGNASSVVAGLVSASYTTADRSQTPPPAPHGSYSFANSVHELSPPRSASPLVMPKSPKANDRLHLDLSPRRTRDTNMIPSGMTPLSPSTSSVGSATETRANNASAAATTTASNATAGPAAHYRMLTSTASERKRTVAACRALRAQIQRFEDAFTQLHGRAPKGAADRAPLATTYAQYREWKRAIRADAAGRIQALFRGARCRAALRTGNPALAHIVRRRVERAHLEEHLSLPRTEEARPPPPAPLDPSTPETPTSSRTAPRSPVEVMAGPSPRLVNGLSDPSVVAAVDNYAQMSFAELQALKRELKEQLKQYDMSFARRNGRMPVKSEKEPIRHLYESYNTLKGLISEMERRPHAPPSPRTISPTSEGSDSEPSSSGAMGGSASPMGRARRRLPQPAPLPVNPSNPAGTDLAALKVEKQSLHTMLRAFEKDFFRENRRQVSSFADIRPVASQYRRYKEIKKQIAALQGSGSDH
jgi:hypothetical protein